MSFEDLEVARAARVAKDAVKSNGKRGRKRKNTEPETSEAELESEVGVEVVSSTKKVKTSKGTRIRRRRSTAVTSVPACRKTLRAETTSWFKGLKSLPRKYIKL
jgi:hypothetical protein